MKRLKTILIDRMKETKLFWKLYFWWGIRQARKRRLAWEAEMAKRPRMTNDEYWESVRKKKATKND
jgi:hypothetical protein